MQLNNDNSKKIKDLNLHNKKFILINDKLIETPLKKNHSFSITNISQSTLSFLNTKRKRNILDRDFVTPIHSKSKISEEELINVSFDSNSNSENNRKDNCNSIGNSDDFYELNLLQLKQDLSNSSNTVNNNISCLSNSLSNSNTNNNKDGRTEQ